MFETLISNGIKKQETKFEYKVFKNQKRVNVTEKSRTLDNLCPGV